MFRHVATKLLEEALEVESGKSFCRKIGSPNEMLNSESQILIVSNNDGLVSSLKQVMKVVGYFNLTVSPTYSVALHRVMEQNFALVLFDIGKSDMMPKDFIRNLKSFEEDSIRVGFSANPELKTVLDLLEVGTHGFLISPFSEDSVREVLDYAKEGPSFNQALFDSVNRIATFKALVLCNLNRLAEAKAKLSRTGTCDDDVAELEKEFFKSVELAKDVAKGQEQLLLNQIVEGCLKAARLPLTRLGRIRRKLREEGIIKDAPDLPVEEDPE